MTAKTLLMLAGALLVMLGNSPIIRAQTVDPCQYGCPKEGCPQCDKGGGPIEQDDDEKDE